MPAKPEYRGRDDTQVAVLDALVDRSEEGMTVFELRSHVEVGIDDLETALSDLKAAGLIDVENEEEPMRIYPASEVVPAPAGNDDEPSLVDRIRQRLPF